MLLRQRKMCLQTCTRRLGIRSQLPRVSYIKAIDVWMSACLMFVFAGLLEYALVNVIARKGELKQQVRFSKEVSDLARRLGRVRRRIATLLFPRPCFFFIEKRLGQTTKVDSNPKTTEWLDFRC